MRWARQHFDPPPLRVRALHRVLRWQAFDLDGVCNAARAAVAPRITQGASTRARVARWPRGNREVATGSESQPDTTLAARESSCDPRSFRVLLSAHARNRLPPAGEMPQLDASQPGDEQDDRAAALHEQRRHADLRGTGDLRDDEDERAEGSERHNRAEQQRNG